MKPREPWIELLEGRARLLLIAPHGGRAGAHARKLANPKVNDLYTADITRELAHRLDARAIINTGMDRNRLDCNRLPQLAERAPWLLDMIAHHLEAIAGDHGRAVVLIVHGWNIIEPRVDFGLGLRRAGDELRPPGAARVSASDDFINGTLASLDERLRAAGVMPTYGMRYPAGGAHNLLQAFTLRYAASPNRALARIGQLSAAGRVEALQLEISVAARIPGEIRARTIDAIARTFSSPRTQAPQENQPLRVVRDTPAPRTARAPRATPATAPARVGIELFDPVSRLGAIASFDVGIGAIGARLMLLFDRHRVALFTGEGAASRSNSQLSLGPLSIAVRDGGAELRFRGPALVVPDATSYISIERALAAGWLEPNVDVGLRFAATAGAPDLGYVLSALDAAAPTDSPPSSIGTMNGSVTVGGTTRPIRAVARAGLSFSGIGPQRFGVRRMLWASFPDSGGDEAVELREISTLDGDYRRSARLLSQGEWSSGLVGDIVLEAPALDASPGPITATIADGSGHERPLRGRVETFIPLSRPGPDHSRIYTALGFANYHLGDRPGAGMFELSRRSDTASRGADVDVENGDED